VFLSIQFLLTIAVQIFRTKNLLNVSSLWTVAVMKQSYLTKEANLKKNAAKGYYLM